MNDITEIMYWKIYQSRNLLRVLSSFKAPWLYFLISKFLFISDFSSPNINFQTIYIIISVFRNFPNNSTLCMCGRYSPTKSCSCYFTWLYSILKNIYKCLCSFFIYNLFNVILCVLDYCSFYIPFKFII